MANIELVIKIPEEVYKASKMNSTLCTLDAIAKNYLIKGLINGTPLPKGHGRLIDIDDIEPMSYTVDGGDYYDDYLAIDWEDIEKAPTIIEADES